MELGDFYRIEYYLENIASGVSETVICVFQKAVEGFIGRYEELTNTRVEL
jgi:hypothetical protein